MVNASPVICFRWRAESDWPVEFVSDNITQWGYSTEDMMQSRPSFAEMIHPDDLQRVVNEVTGYTANGLNTFLQEYRLLTREREVIWVDDRTIVQRDANGKVLFYDGVLTDISERKRLGGLGKHQRLLLRDWLIKRARRRHEDWKPSALVLAGPTAVGKGTVVSHIKQHYPDVHLSISATTRAPRPGEEDGVHYYFVDHAEFDAMIADGSLLEWAEVHGQNKYGTPRRPVEQALAEGKPVLFEIDLQGARQIRQTMPDARHVFLLPPSWDELVRRLENRGTESAEERERRLQTAQDELSAQKEFDVRVVNVEVSEAAKQVVELMGLTKE